VRLCLPLCQNLPPSLLPESTTGTGVSVDEAPRRYLRETPGAIVLHTDSALLCIDPNLLLTIDSCTHRTLFPIRHSRWSLQKIPKKKTHDVTIHVTTTTEPFKNNYYEPEYFRFSCSFFSSCFCVFPTGLLLAL
jgi:hypothetical protein